VLRLARLECGATDESTSRPSREKAEFPTHRDVNDHARLAHGRSVVN
jgi:hypothetical protein